MEDRKKIEAKIRKLEETARALRHGENFNVTRLTSLKSLCQSKEKATAFALELGHVVHRHYEHHSRPKYLEEEIWVRNRRLIKRVDEVMTEIGENPHIHKTSVPWDLWDQIHKAQEEYRRVGSSNVRIVHDMQLLVMEKLLKSVLSGEPEAAYWVYDAAASYANQYDTHYGSGLIPNSAPALEEIITILRTIHGLPRQT